MSQLKVNTIRHTGASSDAITLASDGTATAKITNNLSNRNIIINGGMLVQQRGAVTGGSTSTGYGSVDRWQISTTNTDNLAFVQRQLDSYPDGFSKCFEFDVTTAESALAVDELVYARYKVEAQDLRPLYNSNGSGKNFTLSFWVKAKQTGTYQVSIHKEDNTTRFVTGTYAISTADTWEKKSITITGDSGTSGINADNGQGFDITWKLAAGSNFTSGGAQTSWGSFANTVFAGGHAVNVLDNTANYWRITGVQLEVGDVATDFEHRSYADELARCQRYCVVALRLPVMFQNAAGYISCCSRPNPVPMRAAPSVALGGTLTANPFFGSTSHTTTTTPTLQNNIEDNFVINFTGWSGTTPTNTFGDVYNTSITLDAEL